jgi:hypothetical protein
MGNERATTTEFFLSTLSRFHVTGASGEARTRQVRRE